MGDQRDGPVISCRGNRILMTDRLFNTDDPLAYFITWTSYGTWLPGDDRGWHRWGESEVRPPNELFQQMAAAAMKETEFTLAPEDREVVE